MTVYEAVQPFATESTELTTLLQSYERDYQLSRELLTNPDRDLGDIRDAEMALRDSAITEIDGDIIRGADGEKLDMSGDQMQLSFEGAGGLELEVATIDRPDTREGEISITEKQRKRVNGGVRSRTSSTTAQGTRKIPAATNLNA